MSEFEKMYQLSKIENNISTVKLHDVIIAGEEESFDTIFLIMDLNYADLLKKFQS